MLFSNTELIGLDIGADSVKMVEVDHGKNIPELTTFGIERHKLDISGYWKGSTLRALSKIINKMLDNSDFIGVKTVVSVQNKDVYVTTMNFDINTTANQIKKQINEQAKYFLPYPPNEMRLSWSEVKQNTNSDKKRVIINAIPDFVIENTKNLLEHTNLDGVALENQTLSQIRAIIPQNEEAVILIDVGASHTVFSIIINQNLRASTYLKTGTNSISKDISEGLGIDFEIADNFKKDLGLVNLNALPTPFLHFFDKISGELQNFINMNILADQKANKVFITGGGAYTAGILNYLQATSPIPVFLKSPDENLFLQEQMVPYISPFLHELSTAIGLAKKTDV